MSVTVTTTHKNFSAVVEWLQENVGPVLNCQPIIFWHGQGWHMRSYHVFVIEPKVHREHGWSVEFDREEDAVLFKLRWA